MKKWMKSHQLLVRKIVCVIWDIISVLLANFLALFIRFELSYNNIPKQYLHRGMIIVWGAIVITLLVFYFMHLYSSLWRYASASELVNIIMAASLSSLIYYVLILLTNYWFPRSYYILYWMWLCIFAFAGRFFYRGMRTWKYRTKDRKKVPNVMVIGAGAAGNIIIREINTSKHLNKQVVCVIDDNKQKIGNYIHGIRIVGNRHDIPDMVKQYEVDEIIVAIPTASARQMKELLNICKETGCDMKRVPGLYQLVNGEVSVSRLKDVDVNDLLGREPIEVDLSSIMGYVSGKTVLVTGGGGSIGSELCRQIAQYEPRQLIIVDIYENSAYDIQNELCRTYPELNLVVLIASVRNTKRMDLIFATYQPDIVYHAAAHKHVPLMENSPNEAIKNNVLGTWKVVQAADKHKVKRFVMISTDKAVNPTNIMGASKRICEMIIQTYNNHSQTEFVAVRFGNVLGSNGSVIPLFRKQIEQGGPVTVTHPDIIRYFMTIPEAVSLVLQAGAYAKGGEIFVLDMGEPVKIADLAKNLILLSGHRPDEDIPIVYTGLRPGEKLYEELLMAEEGIQETANKLIHIGKPIQMDEEKFLKQLEELKEYVVEEPENIREKVQEIVDTYQIVRN